jgi:putative transposase
MTRPLPTAINQIWTMGFIHYSLWSADKYRALTVIDWWSRQSLMIEVDVSLTGERVKKVLERLRVSRGLPGVILTDNGPEFTGRVLDQWGRRQSRPAAVHRAGQTDSERVHRVVQQPVARGVP